MYLVDQIRCGLFALLQLLFRVVQVESSVIQFFPELVQVGEGVVEGVVGVIECLDLLLQDLNLARHLSVLVGQVQHGGSPHKGGHKSAKSEW